MSIYEDVIEYCKIDNPAGALLLTGEWGSGKTYFVENDLKSANMVFVRVSLFGISSIEELNNAIKCTWVNIKGGVEKAAVKTQNLKTVLENIKEFLPDGFTKKVYGTVLSIDFMDLLKIERIHKGKKVILVFDDFERNELSTKDKLGVINDYCENKKFNVLILADESKLVDESYAEFKEKVVMRTIRFIPNYKESISGVINSTFHNSYRKFLTSNLSEIVALFSGMDGDGNSLDVLSEEKIRDYIFIRSNNVENDRNSKYELIERRPHNLRSLKATLQDFERIYLLLKDYKVAEIDKWCYSFVSYSLAAKANLLNDNDDNVSLYNTQDVGVLYPGYFDMRFFHDSISNWVRNGIFNKEAISACIAEKNKYTEDSSPKDKVRVCRIDYLDESVAIQGLKDIISDVYSGNLSLEEYVQFIFNSKLAREYNLCELELNWEKVNQGIKKRIEDSVDNGIVDSYDHVIDDLDGYTDEEKKAYEIIKVVRDSSGIMLERNRRDYIQIMRNNAEDAFILLSNKRYPLFDGDMAEATFEAFCGVTNNLKIQFPGYFFGMWKNYPYMNTYYRDNLEKTRKGLIELKDKLKDYVKQHNNQPFKKRYAEVFVKQIDILLTHYE